MSWESHIDNLCSQISRYVGILSKLKYKLKTFVLKTIYHSMIQSKLCYIINVWGSARMMLLKRLSVLQNRALKHTYKVPFLHPTTTLYDSTVENILPLKSIYYKTLSIYVHQCLNKTIHHNIQFEKVEHVIRTRQQWQEKLKRPPAKTTKH